MAKKKLVKKKKPKRSAPSEPELEPELEPDEDESQETSEGAAEESRSKFDLAGSAIRGRARISALASEMGRVWGTHTAMPMDIAPVVNIQRMPIGIIEFDYRTGGGLVIVS